MIVREASWSLIYWRLDWSEGERSEFRFRGAICEHVQHYRLRRAKNISYDFWAKISETEQNLQLSANMRGANVARRPCLAAML